MEAIKAKCTQIIQSETRSTIMLQVAGKDKAIKTQVAISFDNAKEASKFEIGKEYTITVK